MSRYEEKRDEWIRLHGAAELTQNLHHVLEAAENRIAALEAELELSREQTEYANDAMMAMCKRAELAEDELADCAKTCGGLEYRLEQAEDERADERKQHNWTIHVAANLINPLSQVDGIKTLTDAIMAARPPLPPPPH